MGRLLRHGVAVGVAFGLLLNACGMRPYQNPDQRKKPGIFSGSDGEWVIYRQGQSPSRPEAKSTTKDRDDDRREPLEAPPDLE